MRIYTRTGDDGTTSLLGGARVRKCDARVEACGSVDETNAALGLARAAGLPPALDAILAHAQAALFDVGAALATPAPETSQAAQPVADEDVTALERAIDDLESSLPRLRSFILPAGSEAACRLHLARTVARRAERFVVGLSGTVSVHPDVLRYLNRLSDLLFVGARMANRAAGVADVPWHRRPT
jgi:cob(I)alamin adenosyltransferase